MVTKRGQTRQLYPSLIDNGRHQHAGGNSFAGAPRAREADNHDFAHGIASTQKERDRQIADKLPDVTYATALRPGTHAPAAVVRPAVSNA